MENNLEISVAYLTGTANNTKKNISKKISKRIESDQIW